MRTILRSQASAFEILIFEAAIALDSQRALSADVVLALISALKDKDWRVRSNAARALNSNISQFFTLLPNLKQNQLEAIYTRVFLRHRVEQAMPLYIQDNQLHFYTATGPEQPIRLSDNQSKKITEAFRSVQVKAGINSEIKRKGFW